MKRNREESHESHSISPSPPPPTNSEKNSKNVCFRLTNNNTERERERGTMEWYVFNPNKSPSSEKTDTHRRCSGCPRPRSFEKSDLTSFAGPAKQHWEFTSFVILGSCIYCIGGYDDVHITYLKRVLRFDTNRPQEGWKKAPSMNKGRGSPCTEVICGEIYVFGGKCNPDDVGPWAEVFDPVQEAWYALPEPPVNMKSLDHISSVALEEDKKILVAFYSACFLLVCCAYNVSNKRWEFHGDGDRCMPPVIRNCRAAAEVVDRTVYWYDRENIFAYDVDKNIMFSGRVKGLRREGVLHDDDPDDNGIDTPYWLLHLGRENFGLICLGGVHKVSKSLFTCIHCAVLQVSKCIKPNGKGILKLEITTQYVKSYFVQGCRWMLEAWVIEGMLESDDDGNVKDGSGSRTTVWGEVSD